MEPLESFENGENNLKKDEYISIPELLSEGEESLKSHIKKLKELTREFEINSANLRYHYILNYFVEKDVSIIPKIIEDIEHIRDNFNESFSTKDPIVKKYKRSWFNKTSERKFIESYVKLLNEINNNSYDYFGLIEGWSEEKRIQYDEYLPKAFFHTIDWNIDSFKRDLSTVKPKEFIKVRGK